MAEITRNAKDVEVEVTQHVINLSNEYGRVTARENGTIDIKFNNQASPLERIEELELKIDELQSTITTLQEQLNLKVDKHKIIEANKITIGDSRVIIDEEGINVNRPDGVVLVKDGEGK